MDVLKLLIEVITPCGIVSVLLGVLFFGSLMIIQKLYKQSLVEAMRYSNERASYEAALKENVTKLASVIAKQRDVIEKLSNIAIDSVCPLKRKQNEEAKRQGSDPV